MKWSTIRNLTVGMIAGALLTGTLAQASGGTSIEVYFKNLRLMFHGEEKKPETGKVFIYEGSTYVPLRFMSESLGKLVQYDGPKEEIWVGGKRYAQAPEMTIDTAKTYVAEFTTNKGSFTVELYAKDAPLTVNNFVFLARDGYYDGISFHRVIEDFVIQGGDPLGNGTGGPGYSFQDELDNGHLYETGVIAMANAGPNTNGSQFFICTGADSELLNSMPNYSIFGKVKTGLEVVQAISAVSVGPSEQGELSRPIEPVIMESVKITEQ